MHRLSRTFLRVAIALAMMGSDPLVALQLPKLEADRLVLEGRHEDARAAFDAWLSENGESEQLFAVLLRRLALDPDVQSVQRAIALHAASLSAEQVATLQMLPIDFAELSGRHERALELLGVASPPQSRARAAVLAKELSREADAITGGAAATVGTPIGAVFAYQRAIDAWFAGDHSTASDALAVLAARYPASPERYLVERQLASLSSAGRNSSAPTEEATPIVVPFPAPLVLLGAAYPALQHLSAEPAPALGTTDGANHSSGADTAAAVAAPTAPAYTIQTGAYRDAVNADHVANQLRQAGFPAQVEPSRTVDGANLHRVLVGANLQRTAAERVRTELRAAGYDGFLRVAAGA